MGYGMRYARGERMESTGIPASAFSKGDPLMLTSASSLSRLDNLLVGQVAGVAMADSLDSLDNQVPYIVALANTVFVSAATVGSQFTPGEELDLVYTGGRFFVATSNNTGTVVIREDGGSTDFINSNTSEVLVSFMPSNDILEYV
jgi:hypothetical protein